MPIAKITFLETNFEVDYDFKITAHGSDGTPPSLTYPGDAPEAPEFDLEVLGIEVAGQAADVHLDLPAWLKDLLTTYLYESDTVHAAVQQADRDRAHDHDYDYED